jgi:hypothetical protein
MRHDHEIMATVAQEAVGPGAVGPAVERLYEEDPGHLGP